MRYVHENCRYPGKLPTAVPARFVVACKNGHLDDFPWVNFVHAGPPDHPYKSPAFGDGGVRGGSRHLRPTARPATITPDVGCLQAHTTATFRRASTTAPLAGLSTRPGVRIELNQPIRLRAPLQGASNAWFPVMLSALSVPQSSNLLKQLVDRPLERPLRPEGEADIAKMRRGTFCGTSPGCLTTNYGRYPGQASRRGNGDRRRR